LKKRKEEKEEGKGFKKKVKMEFKSIGYSLCLSLLNERLIKRGENSKLNIRDLYKTKTK
jgi:hypothetical protein